MEIRLGLIWNLRHKTSWVENESYVHAWHTTTIKPSSGGDANTLIRSRIKNKDVESSMMNKKGHDIPDRLILLHAHVMCLQGNHKSVCAHSNGSSDTPPNRDNALNS